MSNEDFVSSTRIKIPYNYTTQNITKTIKHFLGQDIKIKDVHINDIITNDECYIVDVKYLSIQFSPYNIYFINVNDLKQLIPSSNIYVTQINNCNIKITSSIISEYKKIIPIRINNCITNNYSTEGQLENEFSYFGIIVKKPMNYLYTPLKYPGHKFTPFELNDVKPIYPESFKCSFISNDDTLSAYKSEILHISILKIVDNVILAKSFDECEQGTNAYVIDVNLLPSTSINGIIVVQPKRHPNLILYYPTMNFIISEEEIQSIKDFIRIETINYMNFEYCMNVINA